MVLPAVRFAVATSGATGDPMLVDTQGRVIVPEAPSPAPPAEPPTAIRRLFQRYRTLVLVACALASVVALRELDARQAEQKDVRNGSVVQGLRAAHLQSLVRQCLDSEPFMPVAGKMPAPTVLPNDAQPQPWKASAPAVGLLQPSALALADLPDYLGSNAARLQAASVDTAVLTKCAYAQHQLALLATPDPRQEFWRTVFTEGSSLNTVLRFVRIALLGVFVLCATELILSALRMARLPVIGLADLAKLANPGTDAPPKADKPEAAKAAGGAWSAIGTALVTGLTSVVVVGPELVQQAVNTSRVAEHQSLDQRSVQTIQDTRSNATNIRQTSLYTEMHKVRVEESVRADATELRAAAAELQRAAELSNQTLRQMSTVLEGMGRATPGAEQWNDLRDMTRRALAAADARTSNAIASLHQRVDGVAAEQSRALGSHMDARAKEQVDLSRQLAALATTASGAAAEAARLHRTVRQRGCATLAYLEDVERKRWFFSNEADQRIQRMRNIMQQAEPTTDCSEFLQPAAPAQADGPTGSSTQALGGSR